VDLTDDEMWDAASGCDASYDGRFFYAVRTVGVYCRPSCKSRTPLRKNVLYFRTSREAADSGFRPCKRCRPDLADYAPLRELAQRTKSLIDRYCSGRAALAGELGQLGVSPGHLAAVFKREFGMAPTEYLGRVRVQSAQKLLAQTDLSILDAAGEAGFESLSSFYSSFKRYTGSTPSAYRRANRERQAEE